MGRSVVVAGPGIARYGLGVICLLVLVLGLGGAALAIRRRVLPGAQGPPAWLATATVALALLIGELELLGAVGLFRLLPIVLGAALIAGAVQMLIRRGTPDGVQPGGATTTRSPRRSRELPLLGLAGLAAAVVLAEWAGPTLQSYDVGIRSFDSLWYHLPWAASFAQTGWTTTLRFTDVEYLTPFYPASAEMLHGLGIVLLARDTLSPAINLIWLGLVLLAAYCIGRTRGVGPLTMLGAALACSTPMMTGSQAGTAANDLAGVFFLLAAVALIPDGERGWALDREDRVRLVLAGVAAGLALSVKLTLLAPIAALTIGVIWLAPTGGRRRAALAWLLPLAVAGVYWYARNLIAVGNPLPWVHIPGLPVPAAPLQANTGFSIAHYLTDAHVWTATFVKGVHAGLGSWWPAVLVATVGGPLLCIAPGSDRRTRMLGLVALASLAAYLVTPETAAGPAGRPLGFAFNLRYGAPALTLSLAVAPLAPRLRRHRLPVAVAVLAVLVATVFKPYLWPGRHVAAAIAIGVIALAAVVALEAWRRSRARAVLVLGAVALLALAVAGYPWQRHYLRGRYAYAPHVSDLARVWALFRGIHGARVGVVGTFGGFFDYPLYGLDDSNRVTYVAAHGPHGSFTPITGCRAWRSAVNAGNFDYVVATPARNPWKPRHLTRSPEAGWTAADPAAHAILRYDADRQAVVVFELSGRLDPNSCT
jgi:hypothetical protein